MRSINHLFGRPNIIYVRYFKKYLVSHIFLILKIKISKLSLYSARGATASSTGMTDLLISNWICVLTIKIFLDDAWLRIGRCWRIICLMISTFFLSVFIWCNTIVSTGRCTNCRVSRPIDNLFLFSGCAVGISRGDASVTVKTDC